ncbi:MAG: hypothetical protein PUG48_01450 [Clostridia bacterium]|nr:hypothetical protein [Clostridia bacterium]
MNEHVKKLIKPMVIFAAIIFACCFFIKKPESYDDYTSYLGYSISGVCVLFVVYERVLWRIIPWNRPPILKKKYAGKLSYVYKKQHGLKDISIRVKQTWLSVEITTKTDINSSYTITGTIVNEYGIDVLYYTYMTDPSAVHQGKNPIQYGTCRMVLNDNNKKIKGKYWTSSQTVGDLEWEEISEGRS